VPARGCCRQWAAGGVARADVAPPGGRQAPPRSSVADDRRSEWQLLARAGSIESRLKFEAGPAANIPGLRAVLRQHAPSATRQRTLKARERPRGRSVSTRRSGRPGRGHGPRR
jgi:hypothetical protein